MKKININTILLIISIVFSAGIYLTKIDAQGEAIKDIKRDYVRKDILEIHLENMNLRLTEIRDELIKQNGGR